MLPLLPALTSKELETILVPVEAPRSVIGCGQRSLSG